MSRNLTPSDVVAIGQLISGERLTTFQDLTSSDDDAIELHQAVMTLASSIMSTTGVVEIALRNSVVDQLAQSYAANWLDPQSTTVPLKNGERKLVKDAKKRAQRAAYGKLDVAAKRALDGAAYPNGLPPNASHLDVAIARQRTLPVSEGQIVAQLTIFFWKSLFADRYEKTLWKRSLKRVFPNKTMSRADIARHLETLYQTRNRLAHHEPVYGSRLDDILVSIDFVIENLGSRRPSRESPVAKFILPHRERLDADVAVFRTTFTRLTGGS